MSPMEQLAKQEYERGYSDGKSDFFAAGVAEGEMRARQRMIANRVVSNQHPFAASGKPIDHIANADKMIGCAYCDNPLFAGTKCNNCGRVTLAEPVKQEHTEQYWLHEINNARADGYERGYMAAKKLYAEPVKHEVHQEPVAHKWPLMGYGNVSIGGCKQPDGTSGLIYLDMGETREIDADTTDLFPVGSKADPSKLLACIYFKDGSAIQQTIDVLREMQIETGYAAPVDAKAIRAEALEEAEEIAKTIGGSFAEEFLAAIRGLK